jgi:hypothetical protein
MRTLSDGSDVADCFCMAADCHRPSARTREYRLPAMRNGFAGRPTVMPFFKELSQ